MNHEFLLHRCSFEIIMQLNDLEQEDEDFRNFLKEVSGKLLRMIIEID